jgi:autotransporter-associated beta strand protein
MRIRSLSVRPWGGIWKTTNGGTTWTPLTDKQATLSISSLAFDPTDPNRLLAGTGLTANGSVLGLAASGGLRNGLLYTQDGGNTWTSLGAATFANQSVVGVAARGNVLVAGTYEISGFAAATERNTGALYRSTDGGANFTKISGATGTGLPNGPISSIVGDPNNPNRLYAAVTEPDATTAGKASTALYVSDDTGAHWSQVFGAAQAAGKIQSSTQTILKIATGPGRAVALALVDYPNTGGSKVTGLFWSGNSGASWSPLPLPALTSTDLNQGSVNSAIAIDPNNKNLVYVSGDGNTNATLPAFRIDVSTMTVNSITDGNTANGSTVHSDSRAITFDASGRLILTSDGTIYARTNPQSDSGAWSRISGNVSAFEVYRVGYDAVGKRLAAAAQDNGVTIQSGRNAPLWNAVMGADGINLFVNDVTFAASGRSVFYANTQNLGLPARIIRDTQGNFLGPQTGGWGVGAKVTCTLNGIHGECADLVAGANNPNFGGTSWVNNRVDPTRMAFGGTDVYVTQDTLTGTQDPTAATVDLTLTDLGPTPDGGYGVRIAYGTRDNPNMIVVGSFGVSQSTTGAGPLVARPSYALAGGLQPTDIVLDPRSQRRYFVADNTNLFGTRDQGDSFTNLTSNLRPIGITRPTALEFISNNGVDALVAGGLNNVANAQSTIAVADSDMAGLLANWRPFGTGLPNTQVSALSYNSTADVLAVGTFGRGVFALYDVTSYFPQATVPQFGLADNDSQPDASFLTDGTRLDGTRFSRPLNKYGTGTLTIAGNAIYTGGTSIFGGALQLGNGGTSGSILGNVTFCSDAGNTLCDPSTNKMLVFNRSDAYTFDGAISGPGQVVQFGSGRTILTAVSTYTGATLVNAGTLSVNGSIASSPVFVNFGGTLGGNGTVGPTTILPGGALSPGNSIGTLTVNGSLTFATASLYLVEVQGNTADRTNASGAATLAGTVGVVNLGGNLARNYTILSAAGGRTGAFDSVVPVNVPAFIRASLAYTPTDVVLNLTSGIGSIAGLTRNQTAVAAALDNSFNNGGGTLLALFGLPASQLPAALDMLSGEGASGTQETAFGAANVFTSIMMDQGAFWRNGETVDTDGATFGGEPLAYAPRKKSEKADHPAFKEIARPAPDQPRWRAWATGFDGTWKLAGEAGIEAPASRITPEAWQAGSIISCAPTCSSALPSAAAARTSRFPIASPTAISKRRTSADTASRPGARSMPRVRSTSARSATAPHAPSRGSGRPRWRPAASAATSSADAWRWA